MNVKHSQQLLKQAKEIAEERNLVCLAIKISNKDDLLRNQLGRWEELINQKPSLSEIIGFTRIDELITQMVNQKIVLSDVEFLQYAIKANNLVRSFEKV